MAKQPLLQSVSHDPSEVILICWFGAKVTLLMLLINITNVKSSCATQYFCANHDHFYHSSEHEYLYAQKGEQNTSCCIKQELV